MQTDLVALLDGGTHVNLFSPSQVYNVVANVPTPEDAVAALVQAAPPSFVKCTFLLCYTSIKTRQRSVEALQKAGYTNIETIDLTSLSLSSNIWNLPLNCEIGELVLVLEGLTSGLPWSHCVVDVIRKCENGWQAIDRPMFPTIALTRYKTARRYVIWEGTPEADIVEITKFFGDRKLYKSVMKHPGFKEAFIRNRINKGNLNGYEVQPYCYYDLLIKFGDKVEKVASMGQVLPFTSTKEVDVGEVAVVEIRADEHKLYDEKPLVKTFKFKTAASRKVLFTVTVDKTLLPQMTLKTIETRSATVSPQLVSEVVVSPDPKPGKLAESSASETSPAKVELTVPSTQSVEKGADNEVSLPSCKDTTNGMPSDVYALLDRESSVLLFKQSEVSLVIENAPTLEDAVSALLRAAPPVTVKGVYILSFSSFERCRRSVEAVQRPGYTVIESVDITRFCISSMICDLPLMQTIGTTIFVFVDPTLSIPIALTTFVVLRKCEKGWQFLREQTSFDDALAKFPSVSEVVFLQNTSETDKAVLSNLFPGLKLHPSVMLPRGFLRTFFQNRINNGSFDGNEVLSFCFFDLVVKYGTTLVNVSLNDTPPFTITKEVDVSDAPDVEVCVSPVNTNGMPLVKTFKFKSAKFRTVVITINVDQTLLPQVSLKTIATLALDAINPTPPELTPQKAEKKSQLDSSAPEVIYTVMNAVDTFFTSAYYQNEAGVGDFFASISDVVARLKMETSTLNSGSNTPIVFHYTEVATTMQQRKFREACQKAGLLNVTLIPFETVSFSLMFESRQITVNPGQLVAVLFPKFFCIVTRDGRNLKVQNTGQLNKFKIDQWKVECVIIANVYNEFPTTALAALRSNLQSVNVHYVSAEAPLDDFVPQFLRNFFDETVSKTYTFNDFCDFDIDIKGHKLISTRFKEIPHSVSENVDVSGTSVLEVNLVKSDINKELLKTFTVKRGTKFVRIMINVESTCDITVTMEAVNKASGSGTTKTSTSQTVEPAQRNSAKNDTTDRPSEAIKIPEVALETNVAREPDTRTVKLPVKQSNGKTPNSEMSPSSDATGGKKSRSQRRKQARRHALQNNTSGEPLELADVSMFCNDIDKGIFLTNLPKELSQLRLDPPPMIILTFTSDNRILIEADETYTGDKQLLAYVRLQCGKPPIVGKDAFDALKTRPASVFYDITRLLAADFDPNYPHPSWRFKTTREADGKLLIHGGDNIVTLPIVLFGLIVNSTLLYIKQHLTTDISTVGIRLPLGSSISDDDLKGVSEKIGVKLVTVDYK